MDIELSYEKNLIINNRLLKYSGIFLLDDIFSVINRALEELGYEKREKKTEEFVGEKGRKIYFELRPFKEKTNFLVSMLKIKIYLNNLREVVEVREGVKRKFEVGELEIGFDAWVLTNYEYRWGMKPFVYFWKGIINKYLYKTPLETNFPAEVSGDTAYVYNKLKKLLDSYQQKETKVVAEEEVKKKVSKEMKSEINENRKKWEQN